MFKNLSHWSLLLWNSPTFTTWGGLFSSTMYGVLLLPIVTTYLTIDQISIWLLLNVFVGLQTLGDLGFGATFSRAISHAYGGAKSIIVHEKVNKLDSENYIAESTAPNWKLIKKLYGTTAFLYLILSIFLTIVIGIIGYLSLQIPIDNLVNKNEGWYSFLIILIAIFINFNGSKYRLFLQGINKVALIQRNQAIISTLTILASSLVVIFTKSLIYLIIIQQIGAIVIVLLLRGFSKKYSTLTEALNHNEKKLDIELLKSIFPIAWKSWIGVLMSYGLVQASGIFIAQIGNSSQTSSYLFSIKIYDIIKNFANAPFYSKIPLMNQLFIKNDKEQLYNLATQRMNLTLLTQTVAFGIVIIFGDDLLKLIGSNVFLVNTNILIILMLSYSFERYGALHIQLLSLSNNIIWHIANGITGILYIVFSYMLLNQLNDPILAFSIALLLSYLCFYSWYAPYRSYTFYKMKFFKTEYKVTLKSILIIVTIIIITF